MDHVIPKEIRSLYRIGGTAAALQLAVVASDMSVFYVVRYPMPARDLFRLARSLLRESRHTPRREACSDTSV